MRYILLAICTSLTLLSFSNPDSLDVDQSSMVGIIDWSSSDAEKTMLAFIDKVEEGFISFTTLPSKSAQADIQKSAMQYHLYIYNPEHYQKYNTQKNKNDYNTLRLYEKYLVMKDFAETCASSIEEDIEYAYKYDFENFLGATGVKIAEVSQKIFSEPYSKVADKTDMDFSDNMIKSSADLTIAQQAAFYSKKIKDLSFKQIYTQILTGFNSAQISYKEIPQKGF